MSLRFEPAYLFGYAPLDRWGGKPLGRLREATDEMRTPPVQGSFHQKVRSTLVLRKEGSLDDIIIFS